MKSLYLRGLIGFLFTVIFGSLLHFLYDWTNESVFVAPFSAVNESTWEHMKLLFLPSFLFALGQSFFLRDEENFWGVKLIGAICGLLLIPVLFYVYNGAFGKSPDWLNISFFFVASAGAYLLEIFLFSKKYGKAKREIPAFIALCILAILFVILTFFPPKLPIFQDPITGKFGIS